MALIDVTDRFKREGGPRGRISIKPTMANAYRRIENELRTALEDMDGVHVDDRDVVKTQD